MLNPTEKIKILLVDDNPNTLELIERNLSSEGYRVFTGQSVAAAIEILNTTTVDLVITDIKMPKVGGLDLVKHVRENHKNTEVMVITGYATVAGAVEAVKTGAEEYLAKPFTDSELLEAVSRVLEKQQLRKASASKVKHHSLETFGLLGDSKAMQSIYSDIAKAAAINATVLITGESGTGKELVARAIHYGGLRSSGALIPVNCGGIPEGLLESQLFGHIKGAFTGATETRAGFFQTADRGTIFLDEISEISPAMQVTLLRVLQERAVRMVGDTRAQRIDVRILAATNKDLEMLVAKGVFREDLFFRLNVININIPPLRERGDDILRLSNHFLFKYAEEFGKTTPRFSDVALQVLKNYHWPGNVRELENVIQRIVAMTDGEKIEAPDLPSLMRFKALRETGFNRPLSEVEAEHIRNVLISVDKNKTKAAIILGIDRKTLREKIKRYDLDS